MRCFYQKSQLRETRYKSLWISERDAVNENYVKKALKIWLTARYINGWTSEKCLVWLTWRSTLNPLTSLQLVRSVSAVAFPGQLEALAHKPWLEWDLRL